MILVPFMRLTLVGLAPLLITLSASELPTQLPEVSAYQSGSGFRLDWTTIEGQSYQLQRWPGFGEWQGIGESTAGTGEAMTYAEPMSGRMFYRVQVSDQRIREIAVLGDSITEQGSLNLIHLGAVGYYGWARVFNGSRWDLQASGSTFRFATGGKRSDEVSALHLASVIDSGADACVVAYGTNDAYQLRPVATFVAQAVSDWLALRAAGIEPVGVTVLPMGSVGGANAERQARVAEYNVALRAAAAEHDVILCDWTTVLEAVPGSNNGVGLDSYYINNDNLHPRPLAASKLGRVLAATLDAGFTFGIDPYLAPRWLTENTGFAGSNGQPAGQWQAYAASGGAITAKELIPSDDGNWWQISISPGTSTGNFNLISFAATVGGSPAGKRIEGIAELQVVSGSVDNVTLQAIGSGGAVAIDLSAGQRAGDQITTEDGIVVLRTPPVTLGAGVTNVVPSIYFNSSEISAVVRVRRCGILNVE